MKYIKLGEFLTNEQINLAAKLKTAKLIHDQITLPNIAHINQLLGQENDAMYLAYAIEFSLNCIEEQKKFTTIR